MAEETSKKLTIRVGATDTATPVLDRIDRRLDNLKRTFGARGPLKDIFELAVAGGPIAAIGFGVNLLAKAVDHTAQLVGQFKAGELSAGQLVDGIARGVPVLGNMWGAMTSIIDAIQGATAEQKKFKEAAEASAKAWQQIHDLQTPSGTVQQINRTGALAGLTPEQRERQEAQTRAEDLIAKLDQEANEDFKKLGSVLGSRASQTAKDEAQREADARAAARRQARQQIDQTLGAEFLVIEKKYADERTKAAVKASEFALQEFTRQFVSGTAVATRDFAREATEAARLALMEAGNAAFQKAEFARGLIGTPDFAPHLLPQARFAGIQDERFTTGVGESQRERLQAEIAKANKEMKDLQKRQLETFENKLMPLLQTSLQFLLNPPEVL